jgi:hypothetical protein
MPGRVHPVVPGSNNPMVVAESETHVTIAIDIEKTELARHRRFIETLLTMATPRGS